MADKNKITPLDTIISAMSYGASTVMKNGTEKKIRSCTVKMKSSRTKFRTSDL